MKKRNYSSDDMPGKDGMTLVEYQGRSVSDMSWWGAVTGTRYYLGGNRKRGYIDNRDLRTTKNLGILQLYEKGATKPTFIIAKPRPVTPEPVVLEPVIEVKNSIPINGNIPVKIGENSTVTQEIDSVSDVINGIDPSEYSVPKLKLVIEELNQDQIKAVLAKELEGKNRKSAITYMEKAISA